MGGRITQNGTNRFLQARVDPFVRKVCEAGQALHPIKTAQVTGAVSRTGRVVAFDRTGGLPHIIHGAESGCLIETTVAVTSSNRRHGAALGWGEIADLVTAEADA